MQYEWRSRAIVVVIVAILVGVVAVGAWWIGNHPRHMRYLSHYAGGMILEGYGDEWFSAEYRGLVLARRMVDSRAPWPPLEVVIDGERKHVSAIDEAWLQGFGARYEPESSLWVLASPSQGLSVRFFEDGRLDLLSISWPGGGKNAAAKSIAISWEGQAPVQLPLKDTEVHGYFGDPQEVEERWALGP